MRLETSAPPVREVQDRFDSVSTTFTDVSLKPRKQRNHHKHSVFLLLSATRYNRYIVYKCNLRAYFWHNSQNCTGKTTKSMLVLDLCACKIRFTIASPISLYTVFSWAQLIKNWFWGQRTKQMVAQHEVLAGGKSDRYLAKKGLIYGCIQTFILFFWV